MKELKQSKVPLVFTAELSLFARLLHVSRLEFVSESFGSWSVPLARTMQFNESSSIFWAPSTDFSSAVSRKRLASKDNWSLTYKSLCNDDVKCKYTVKKQKGKHKNSEKN